MSFDFIATAREEKKDTFAKEIHVRYEASSYSCFYLGVDNLKEAISRAFEGTTFCAKGEGGST